MAHGTCSISGCDTYGVLSRGWCAMHYGRWRRTGTTDDPIPRIRKTRCAVDGCERGGRMTRGYCAMHYYRLRHSGEVGPVGSVVQLSTPDQTCSVDGCERGRPLRHGWCTVHYQRWATHGDPTWEPPAPVEACSVDGCHRPHASLGYCGTHYMRLRRCGSVEDRDRPRKLRGKCTVDGCGKPELRHNLCSRHYHRWKQHGDPLARVRARENYHPDTCQVEGCDAPYRGKGMCRLHYSEWHHRENKVRRNAKMRAHYLANREYYYAKTTERRERVARLVTKTDRLQSAARRRDIAGDPCWYCGGPGENNDHFFPIAKGGTDHFWNLVRSCEHCNKSKAAHCGTWFTLRRGGSRGTDGSVPAVAEADQEHRRIA
jgi:hypothetical protein